MDGAPNQLGTDYPYRIKHQAATGQETVWIALIGGTKEEKEKYKQEVNAAIF